jgi:hypothetical protein
VLFAYRRTRDDWRVCQNSARPCRRTRRAGGLPVYIRDGTYDRFRLGRKLRTEGKFGSRHASFVHVVGRVYDLCEVYVTSGIPRLSQQWHCATVRTPVTAGME